MATCCLHETSFSVTIQNICTIFKKKFKFWSIKIDDATGLTMHISHTQAQLIDKLGSVLPTGLI
jgi:hypothetical protein